MAPTSGLGNIGPQDPRDEGHAGIFRFGRFELHLERHELRRDGRAVELQPKVFAFIAYLLINRGRLVDKNELLEAVWPRQVVTEAALSRCAMKARRALEDEAEDPQVIQTVHGRGYRFIATVEPVTERRSAPREERAPAADESGEPGGTAPRARHPTGRRGWLLGGLAALLLALSVGYFVQERSASTASQAGVLRVAVLPVANQTGAERYDWARLGLMTAMEDILRTSVPVMEGEALARIDDSVAGLPADERRRRLRELLGPTHILEAGLHRNGSQLRLDFELASPDGRRRQGTVLATDAGELARAAAAQVRAYLGLFSGQDPVAEDSFANEAYLRGMSLRLQGDVAGAQRYFQLAMEQAPLAFWPRLKFALGEMEAGDIAPAQQRMQALMQEVDDDGDPLHRIAARNALAVLRYRAGDNDASRALLEEALAMARDSGRPDVESSVLSRLGILETYADRYAEAREHLRAAIDAERRMGVARPSPELRHSQATLALREGDLASAGVHLEDAIGQFRLVGNRRNEATALNSLANLRRREGRFEDARTLAASALEAHRALGNPTSEASALINLAIAEAQLGQLEAGIAHAEAALALAEKLGQRPHETTALSLLGQFSLDLGRYDAARTRLQQALASMTASGDVDGARRQRLLLARLAMNEDDLPGAEQTLRALLDDAAGNGTLPLRLDTLRQLAQVRLRRGDPVQARELLEQALAMASQLDDPRRTAQLHARMAEAWLASGDTRAAAEALARSAGTLAGDPLQLRVEADLLAATGDLAGAVDKELAARAASGQRWQAEDAARLAARQAALR